MIELYKDGDHMAIVTDCKDEHSFIQDISDLISNMIYDGSFMASNRSETHPILISPEIKNIKAVKQLRCEGNKDCFGNDWAFQFYCWFPQIVDICCKYRGYKSTVREHRVLTVGDPGLNASRLVGKYQVTGSVHGDCVGAVGDSCAGENEDVDKPPPSARFLKDHKYLSKDQAAGVHSISLIKEEEEEGKK